LLAFRASKLFYNFFQKKVDTHSKNAYLYIIIKKQRDMEREFKIDITLAAEVAQFLEGILEAEFNEELDAEAPVTDTYLDQFMPNGFVPNEELIQALLASGIVKPVNK